MQFLSKDVASTEKTLNLKNVGNYYIFENTSLKLLYL